MLWPSRPRAAIAHRIATLALVTVTGACLGACAATEKGDSAPQPFRAIVTAADLAKLPPSSPRMTVMRLWHDGQVGNTPGIVAAYHSRVQAALGRSNISGAYAVRRTTLAASRPTIASSETTPQGQLLTLRITSTLRQGQPVPAAQKLPVSIDSFLLRQEGGRWVVVHDSLLEPALTEFRVSLGGGRASTSAVRSGRRLAQRYRDLFLAPATG